MYFYSQSTGSLKQAISHALTVIGTGYAGGNCGKNPEGRNNPAMEGVRCVGPLPRGVYTIGAPVDHTHLGPCAMPLTPDPANDMMGRSAFFIHADTVTFGDASEGCIVLGPTIRRHIADNLAIDNQITVTE
jgi:type VI secretion system (T6SS) effector TldE1-like protein